MEVDSKSAMITDFLQVNSHLNFIVLF